MLARVIDCGYECVLSARLPKPWSIFCSPAPPLMSREARGRRYRLRVLYGRLAAASSVQFSSVQFLDRLGRREDMTDDSAEILLQLSPRKAP